MKKTRGLSLILAIAVIISTFSFSAYAEGNTITAYITISAYGNIVQDKNGEYLAEKPVELTGGESYNLDDLFREAHELYYEGGAEAGYASGESEWGLSVTKVWGDMSGKYGYKINGADAWGLADAVSDGDYVDLCVYENYYPETESYAKFNLLGKTTVKNHATELTLYESYYGPNWETLFRASSGATIFINGEETSIVTDENGNCSISFAEYGEYVISAKKTKVLVDEDDGTKSIVAAITAPVCIIKVEPVSVECKYQVRVDVDETVDIEHSQMIVAGYRDGMLIDTTSDINWNGGRSVTVYLDKMATDIKLFFWNSLSAQEPERETEFINLK